MQLVKTVDKGFIASAKETLRQNSRKLGLYALAFCVTVIFSTLAAHAQAAPAYGLGTDGGPVGTDYLSAGSGFASNLGPILKSTLPLMLGMLAVWQGPRIIKSLVKRFSS